MKSTSYGNNHLPALDGLRAISALIVVTVHMHDDIWGWLNGARGVTMFFVLSGYLITSLALREEQERGRLSLTAFYVRRSFRIFPLYYLVLGIYCTLILVLGLSPEKRDYLAGALPYYLTYLQEIPFVYGVGGERANMSFYQSWTLGIEEKFYLVWPLIGFVLWRLSNDRLRYTTVLAISLLAIPLSLFALGLEGIATLIAPYFQIIVGCILALLLHQPLLRDRIARLASSGKAQVLVLLSLAALHFGQPHLQGFASQVATDLYAIFVAGLLAIVLLTDSPLRTALSRSWLAFIGRLSYGIYLIHILCLNIAEKIIPPGSGKLTHSTGALMLTWTIAIAVAYGLHIAIEKPLIRVGKRWSGKILDRSGVGAH